MFPCLPDLSQAEDALRAIDELNGHAIQNKRLKVAPCRRGEGADEIKNANLYVANLPKTVTEDELRAMFEIHGEIIRTKILVDQGMVVQSSHVSRQKYRATRSSVCSALLASLARSPALIHSLVCSLAYSPARWESV